MSSEYNVKLPIFEGPLDLLLHLIKVNEMEITEISISQITAQYLETLRLMENLDLEVAGEFLVMAASLLNIKLRSILPEPEEEIEEGDQEGEGDDYLSARALMQRLIEYRRFKEAALTLGGMAERRALIFVREVALPTLTEAQADTGMRGDLNLLLEAFSRVIKFVQRRDYHEVQSEEFTIEAKITLMRRRLLLEERLVVDELFRECHVKIEMIVTLIALLELCRLKELTISQLDSYGNIIAYPRREGEGSAAADAALENEEIKKIEAEILANRTGLIDNSPPPEDEEDVLLEQVLCIVSRPEAAPDEEPLGAFEPEAEAETEPAAEPGMEPEAAAAEVEIEPLGEIEVVAEPEAEAEVEALPVPETEVEIAPEAEAEVEAEPVAETEVEIEPEAEAEVEAEPVAETEVEIEPEAEAEVEAEPEAEVEIAPGAEVEAEPEAEAEAESEVETEPESEVEPEPEPEAETEVEAEPEAEVETEPEAETEVEAEPVAEVEIEPEAETEVEAEPVAGTEVEPEPALAPEPGPVEVESESHLGTSEPDVPHHAPSAEPPSAEPPAPVAQESPREDQVQAAPEPRIVEAALAKPHPEPEPKSQHDEPSAPRSDASFFFPGNPSFARHEPAPAESADENEEHGSKSQAEGPMVEKAVTHGGAWMDDDAAAAGVITMPPPEEESLIYPDAEEDSEDLWAAGVPEVDGGGAERREARIIDMTLGPDGQGPLGHGPQEPAGGKRGDHHS